MPDLPEFFPDVSGFQWDSGNSEKNWRGHGIRQADTEQIFFNRPIVVARDTKHSGNEERYFSLGRTDAGRALVVVFTLRGPLLRVISARPMSRRERRVYGKTKGS